MPPDRSLREETTLDPAVRDLLNRVIGERDAAEVKVDRLERQVAALRVRLERQGSECPEWSPSGRHLWTTNGCLNCGLEYQGV